MSDEASLETATLLEFCQELTHRLKWCCHQGGGGGGGGGAGGRVNMFTHIASICISGHHSVKLS